PNFCKYEYFCDAALTQIGADLPDRQRRTRRMGKAKRNPSKPHPATNMMDFALLTHPAHCTTNNLHVDRQPRGWLGFNDPSQCDATQSGLHRIVSLIPGLIMHRFLAVLALASWITAAHAQKADLIVTNAKIVTLDPASTIAQALAVRDGKI